MTIEQLQYICMVAKMHSITNAAEELFVTQQTISKAMNKLEKELDVKLLNRSHKGVTLTPEGALFVDEAKEIVEKIDALYDMICPDAHEKELEGQLVVTMASYVSALIGTGLLTTYHKKYKKVQLKISEKLTVDIVTELIDGAIEGVCLISSVDGDIGLGSLKEYSDSIDMKVLYEDELQVYVSPKSRLAQKNEVSLDDLEGLYAGYGFTPGTAYILKNRYGTVMEAFTNSTNVSLIGQAVMDEVAFGISTKAIAKTDPFYKDFVMLSIDDHPKVQVCLIKRKDYEMTELEVVFLNEVNRLFSTL